MNTVKPLLLIAFLFQCFMSSGGHYAGKNAPDMSSLVFVQPANASLNRLEGKVVVLEFWATWCTPCLANQPHLNQLQAAFKDKDVVFISITDEPTAKVERFLKKRDIKGWVACDTGRKVFSALQVAALPRTLIVGKNGTIRYDGRPEQLSETLLTSALEGNLLAANEKPERAACPKLGSWSGGTDPAFTVHYSINEVKFPYQHVIRKSLGTSGYGYSCGDRFSGITLLGQNLSEIYAFCLDLPGDKRVLNFSKADNSQQWDIVFSRNVYLEPDSMGKIILLSLEQTLDLKVKDSLVQQAVISPVIATDARVMQERNIDFDDPVAKSYTTLTDIFSRLESNSDQLVEIEERDDHLYLDTYEIASTIYKMNAEELKKWLAGKGVTFSVKKANINMVVIR